MNPNIDASSLTDIANAFVNAHLTATALPGFPGEVPATPADAYAVQRGAIDLWPEPVVGWKVARVAPAFRAAFAPERLIGPIFAGGLQQVGAPFPVIAGGAGALEAEIIVRLGADAPAGPIDAETARGLIAAIHVGIEVAGSAFAANNALGPLATVCGLGNSLGVLVGPEIAHDTAEIACAVRIDGALVGEATGRLADALAALAFAATQAADLGLPLRAGQWISTGAITGVHPFAIGQQGEVTFAGLAPLTCTGTLARPVTTAAA